MLQGIPYFRLLLGNETEVQLGDLAGNAMSLTVVSATMLAAITCKQLRKEKIAEGKPIGKKSKAQPKGKRRGKKKDEDDEESDKEDSDADEKDDTAENMKKSISDVTKSSSTATADLSIGASNAISFFEQLAALAPAAVNASIWCTCETSGSNSMKNQFLRCKVCRVSLCRGCIGTTSGYNTTSHDLESVDISHDDHNLAQFQSKLRDIVPPSLFFNKEGLNEISQIDKDCYRVNGLSNCCFNLHQIKRDIKKWFIIYYARKNNGIGEAVASFKLTVGEIVRSNGSFFNLVSLFLVGQCGLGMMGEFTSFVPAQKEPLVYGPLEPCTKITIMYNNTQSLKPLWESRDVDTTASLQIVGEGVSDSIRKEVGLTELAAETLKNAVKTKVNSKVYEEAKKRGEKFRWVYPKNWKEWPEVLSISKKTIPKTHDNICGKYIRAKCRQSTNQSALWIKPGTGSIPTLYFIMKPNVNRTGPDVGIITSSILFQDVSSILAVLPVNWQPCNALLPKYQNVTVSLKNWITLKNLECKVPLSSIQASSPDDENVLVTVSGLSSTDIHMISYGYDASQINLQLSTRGGQKAQHTLRAFNYICVPFILRHMARNGLKFDLTKNCWVPLQPSNSAVYFGCCQNTVPPRPTEIWYFNDERKWWDRTSEPGASRKYYLALQDAPRPFSFLLDKQSKSLTVKVFPEVVAHYAAHQLIEGRGENIHKEVSVTYCLMDAANQSDPVITDFTVGPCDAEKSTEVKLKGPHKLYERQQKVVTKMLAIESQTTTFEEIEISEQEMPGSTGLSILAKASRIATICGGLNLEQNLEFIFLGVIADAIGTGKTVISIALILHGLEQARKSREYPSNSGASLVVVPPGLILQWESEINKFSESLNIVSIYDLEKLKSITLKQIINADVVIFPIDILESKGYLDHLVQLSIPENIQELPKLPPYAGQIEQIGAAGVWIPFTSSDPYGGANNTNNQKRRNQSAYYTYVYLKAIKTLRKKEFKQADKGIPLEYFEWERIFVDEIHESLCTTRQEIAIAKENDKSTDRGFFKEKNRRAGRELLGITQKDLKYRPLIFRKSIFGLTGTPLLDSTSRVIELANLMGNTYVIGLSSHWRKLERESCRDIFLHNYLEPKQGREMRKNIYAKCENYLHVACCRNKSGEEMAGIKLVQHVRPVSMTDEEKVLYKNSQHGIDEEHRGFGIKPDHFDVSHGHDISIFLRQNAKFETRGRELIKICNEILQEDKQTKIVVFTDGRIGAGEVARNFLCQKQGLGCTWLDADDSVENKNKKIFW